jgi:hypothetical protein
MLGVIRIHRFWMSGFRDTVEGLYGCSRKILIASKNDERYTDGVDDHRDRKLRRRIPLITICRGCIRILSGLERGSEGSA